MGAQLSLLREKACGKRVSVLWLKDDAFYRGTISAFDDMEHVHRIEYDDGDFELLRLWKESITLLVSTSWPTHL